MASPAVNLHDHYSVIYPPIFSRLFTMPVISLGHSNDSPTLFPSLAHFLSCGLINLLTGDLKFHYEHSPGAPLTLPHPPWSPGLWSMLHILTNSTLCHLRISFMLFLCHYTLFSRQLPLLKFHPSSSTSQNISEELCKSMENLFFSLPLYHLP